MAFQRNERNDDRLERKILEVDFAKAWRRRRMNNEVCEATRILRARLVTLSLKIGQGSMVGESEGQMLCYCFKHPTLVLVTDDLC